MWYSVVPPVLAIFLAFLTHHVLSSLGIAILVGGLLTQVPQAPLSIAAWFEGFKTVGIYVADAVTNNPCVYPANFCDDRDTHRLRRFQRDHRLALEVGKGQKIRSNGYRTNGNTLLHRRLY